MATKPVDFRNGMDGLARLVKEEMRPASPPPRRGAACSSRPILRTAAIDWMPLSSPGLINPATCSGPIH